jgi:predicted RNA-binding protein with RPS1 domain
MSETFDRKVWSLTMDWLGTGESNLPEDPEKRAKLALAAQRDPDVAQVDTWYAEAQPIPDWALKVDRATPHWGIEICNEAWLTYLETQLHKIGGELWYPSIGWCGGSSMARQQWAFGATQALSDWLDGASPDTQNPLAAEIDGLLGERHANKAGAARLLKETIELAIATPPGKFDAHFAGLEATSRLAEEMRARIKYVQFRCGYRWEQIVLESCRAIRDKADRKKEMLLASLQEGDIRDGTVIRLCDFGAFVDLGDADGLIHLSELSWRRVSHPRKVLSVGDKVQVYVLNVDRERKRIGLSLKRLESDTKITETYNLDAGESICSGRVEALAGIRPLDVDRLKPQLRKTPESSYKEGRFWQVGCCNGQIAFVHRDDPLRIPTTAAVLVGLWAWLKAMPASSVASAYPEFVSLAERVRQQLGDVTPVKRWLAGRLFVGVRIWLQEHDHGDLAPPRPALKVYPTLGTN